MGKGGLNHSQGVTDNTISWAEIHKHNTKKDLWVVIDGLVYDLSTWAARHPGGPRILQHHGGQDATEAWISLHHNRQYVEKFMRPLVVGRLEQSELGVIPVTESPLMQDFRKLRQTLRDQGYFRPQPWFYVAIIAHLILFELLGWLVLRTWGTGWLPYTTAALLLTVTQAEAGWSQHDFGHLSVFSNNKYNHAVQLFILNFLKGASCAWWNYRHNIHHAKPNVIRKDPDVRLDYLFLIGKVLPLEYGKKKKGRMPFQLQHRYWFLVMPPLLLPLYFNFEIPYFLISRRAWKDLFLMGTFFVRWQLIFGPMLGFWGVFGLFLFVRFFESHWFVWCTQMSHIPMKVEYDAEEDWVTSQLKATCNVHPSLFTNWFSGHLNFQIEHHLFPTMPRHNYEKVAPLVKSLCKKHGVHYEIKGLWRAFADIVDSLKESGEMWLDAYNM